MGTVGEAGLRGTERRKFRPYVPPPHTYNNQEDNVNANVAFFILLRDHSKMLNLYNVRNYLGDEFVETAFQFR